MAVHHSSDRGRIAAGSGARKLRWWRRQRRWRSGAEPWHSRRYLHFYGDGHRGLWSFSLEPQRDSHFDRDLAEISRRAEEDCCFRATSRLGPAPEKKGAKRNT